MAASSTYESQLNAINKQLQGYSKDLPGQIKSEIERAWTPGLERATSETQRLMSEYLPRYWSMASEMGGTTAADLSPQQKLAAMGRELGNMSGRLTATQSVSDYLGGQMKDLYTQAQQSATLGQQNLADEYNRMFNLYQLAKQEEEVARSRALQERLAQLQLDSYLNNNTDNGFTDTTTGGGGEENLKISVPNEAGMSDLERLYGQSKKDFGGGALGEVISRGATALGALGADKNTRKQYFSPITKPVNNYLGWASGITPILKTSQYLSDKLGI